MRVLITDHIVEGDAPAGTKVTRMVLGMQGSCADLKANAIGHSGRSWTKGGGERQTVVIVHQGNDGSAKRFFVWSARGLLPPPPIQNWTGHFHDIRLLSVWSCVNDTSSLSLSDVRKVPYCFCI